MLDEVDSTTVLLLEETGRLGVQLENGEVTKYIAQEEFQQFWRWTEEGMTPLLSRTHFGYCKAATESDKITSFLTKKAALVARVGVPPGRWSYRLVVMTEKVADLALANKLWAVLLAEADFDMHIKLVFRRRMVELVRVTKSILDVQFRDKGSTSKDGKFSCILATDTSPHSPRSICSMACIGSLCCPRVAALLANALYMQFSSGSVASWSQSKQLLRWSSAHLHQGWKLAHCSMTWTSLGMPVPGDQVVACLSLLLALHSTILLLQQISTEGFPREKCSTTTEISARHASRPSLSTLCKLVRGAVSQSKSMGLSSMSMQNKTHPVSLALSACALLHCPPAAMAAVPLSVASRIHCRSPPLLSM